MTERTQVGFWRGRASENDETNPIVMSGWEEGTWREWNVPKAAGRLDRDSEGQERGGANMTERTQFGGRAGRECDGTNPVLPLNHWGKGTWNDGNEPKTPAPDPGVGNEPRRCVKVRLVKLTSQECVCVKSKLLKPKPICLNCSMKWSEAKRLLSPAMAEPSRESCPRLTGDKRRSIKLLQASALFDNETTRSQSRNCSPRETRGVSPECHLCWTHPLRLVGRFRMSKTHGPMRHSPECEQKRPWSRASGGSRSATFWW